MFSIITGLLDNLWHMQNVSTWKTLQPNAQASLLTTKSDYRHFWSFSRFSNISNADYAFSYNIILEDVNPLLMWYSLFFFYDIHKFLLVSADSYQPKTGPCSTVRNVSGNRCKSDFRSRGRELDHSRIPYYRGDWSWNNFYGHPPPFRWIIQEGLLSDTSESMCTKYWFTACSSLLRKMCG